MLGPASTEWLSTLAQCARDNEPGRRFLARRNSTNNEDLAFNARRAACLVPKVPLLCLAVLHGHFAISTAHLHLGEETPCNTA